MLKFLAISLSFLAAPAVLLAQQPTVRVEPANLHGPRPLQQQTADSAIRDYLQSWQSMKSALAQNRADLLQPDFVGTAQEKLAATIHQQAALGLRTEYRDRSHDIQIVFYSPEGLSIQLVDNVEYDEQVFDHDHLLASHPVHARYIAVMTPSEVRWRVRIFQGSPD